MQTEYVLVGYLKDGTKGYYQETQEGEFYGYDLVKLCTHIDEAAHYSSIEEVEKIVNKLHDPILKIYPVCPICGEEYDGHPAISRKDNKSKICSNCGVGEAFMDFIEHYKKTNN